LAVRAERRIECGFLGGADGTETHDRKSSRIMYLFCAIANGEIAER